MRMRILLLILFAVFLTCAGQTDARAQTGKPSQTLREVTEYRKKLMETHQRDAERKTPPVSGGPDTSGPAPFIPPDSGEMEEAYIKFATEKVAGFKVEDWKGEELRMLGELYQMAEQFAPAADAFRAFLKNAGRSDSGVSMRSFMVSNVRARLIHTLIESEQLDEAEKLMEGGEWVVDENPSTRASRTGFYIILAGAFRDRGLHDKAATLAEKGYKLANNLIYSGELFPTMLESMETNQVLLAAMGVAAYERIGRKKEADDLNKLALNTDFHRSELRSVYETELSAARLIGSPAPELDVSRWIEGNRSAPKNLNELRGNVVLLNFWAMWSEPYVNASSRLRGLQAKFGGKGFEIVGVTKFYGRSDTEEFKTREQELKGLENYKERRQLTYPFAVGKMDDVTNEERFGVTGLPTIVLIDRQGVVRHIRRGAAGGYRKLEKQIEKLLGEK